MNCSKKPELLVFAERKLKIKDFPSAILFYYNKTGITNITIPMTASVNDVLQMVSDLLVDRSIKVNSEDDFEVELTNTFQEEKIAIVLFHESETISISFRTFVLLSKYKSYFSFINYKNPSDAVKNKYGIKKIPKILAIVPQSFISSEGGTLVIGYEGVFLYHEIARFMHNVWFLN